MIQSVTITGTRHIAHPPPTHFAKSVKSCVTAEPREITLLNNVGRFGHPFNSNSTSQDLKFLGDFLLPIPQQFLLHGEVKKTFTPPHLWTKFRSESRGEKKKRQFSAAKSLHFSHFLALFFEPQRLALPLKNEETFSRMLAVEFSRYL